MEFNTHKAAFKEALKAKLEGDMPYLEPVQ